MCYFKKNIFYKNTSQSLKLNYKTIKNKQWQGSWHYKLIKIKYYIL